eukprot:1159119-Pelagomonas_calceolata.AAC.6
MQLDTLDRFAVQPEPASRLGGGLTIFVWGATIIYLIIAVSASLTCMRFGVELLGFVAHVLSSLQHGAPAHACSVTSCAHSCAVSIVASERSG